jgi:NitT/TauT family transport system ATP-binding protein
MSAAHDQRGFIESAAKPTPKISVQNLNLQYRLQAGRTLDVLRSVSFDVEAKQFICLVGPSGSGKTTLLNVIAGLLAPTSGQVLVDGTSVRGPGRERGLVFQQDAIFMWRTVIRNIEYGLELRRIPANRRRETANNYLKLVGLEGFGDLYPKELSGGMKKRVAIAMVFANEPECLLMDEPFGQLDYPTKVTLQKELLRIWEQERRTTVFVTHDLEEAIFLADRILVLQDGAVVRTVDVPFSRPREDSVRAEPEFQRLKMGLWDLTVLADSDSELDG